VRDPLQVPGEFERPDSFRYRNELTFRHETPIRIVMVQSCAGDPPYEAGF
jgi:hypothetical protein